MSEDSGELRAPPERVRTSKLQEIHVAELVAIDHACTELYWALGHDAAAVPQRRASDFYKLPRSHSVWVAEADGDVAGFIAFRDESPGVGFIEDLQVNPQLQRFGIGRRLVEKAELELRHLGFHEVVLKVWDDAPWALGFYRALGFERYDGSPGTPEKVRAWREEKVDTEDRPYLQPGQSVLWRKLT
jgi:ribosomal protein S18 acetylase RimI-like enzyme